MSRNKREGYYGGQWVDPYGRTGKRKHHRIFHHPKPAGCKCVGLELLIAIF